MPASAQQQEHAVERAGRLFKIIKVCADSAEPLPSTPILARRFGVKAPCINRTLHFLEANGMIELSGKGAARTITIAADGRSVRIAA